METIQSVLIQIPIVGIFIWFILEQQKRSDAAQAARDKAAQDSQAARDKEWRDFLQAQRNEMKEQDNQWRLFITEQREQNSAATSRLAEEIKANTAQIAQMTGVLIAHDTASRERALRP